MDGNDDGDGNHGHGRDNVGREDDYRDKDGGAVDDNDGSHSWQ